MDTCDVDTMETPRSSFEIPQKRMRISTPEPGNPLNLASLPEEVLLYVFSYLDIVSLHNCAMLCKRLNSICKNQVLYKKIYLNFNMKEDFLEAYFSKIFYPREVTLDCQPEIFTSRSGEAADDRPFKKYAEMVFQEHGEMLKKVNIKNCRDHDIFKLLLKCRHLQELTMYQCKLFEDTCTSVTSLSTIQLTSCNLPQRGASEFAKNNTCLKKIHLSDNKNVHIGTLCETLSMFNDQVEEIYFGDMKSFSARSLRTLGRLTQLKKLILILHRGFDTNHNSPEDSLEQIAAGCPNLECLTIHGWREVTDEQFLPIIHLCCRLKHLDLQELDITTECCKRAALSCVNLQSLSVKDCGKVNKKELAKLQKDFPEVDISF